MTSNRYRFCKWASMITGGAMLCGVAFGAPATAAASAATSPSDAAQAAYRKQVESCNNGTSNEDKATCLKEAGAALAEARKGKLDDANKNYKQNATERCDALSGDDRDACMARMKGQGVTEGAVGSGGIVRELRTTKSASAPDSTPISPAK